ncbi:MAG: DUF1844 domain-containing protein [Acidobacteria bacterium]|nr:DUF1844 domain-containing protein [Acidobacteriota bacterium]
MSESSEFKVSDRRRFSADGEPLDEAAAAPPPEEVSAPAEDSPVAEAVGDPAEEPPQAQTAPPPPPASFELLVYSLIMQAEMSLGFAGGPDRTDLPMARHAIDMLGVLQTKTKGNLELAEQRLLENSLTELRFRFVQRSQEISRGDAA